MLLHSSQPPGHAWCCTGIFTRSRQITSGNGHLLLKLCTSPEVYHCQLWQVAIKRCCAGTGAAITPRITQPHGMLRPGQCFLPHMRSVFLPAGMNVHQGCDPHNGCAPVLQSLPARWVYKPVTGLDSHGQGMASPPIGTTVTQHYDSETFTQCQLLTQIGVDVLHLHRWSKHACHLNNKHLTETHCNQPWQADGSVLAAQMNLPVLAAISKVPDIGGQNARLHDQRPGWNCEELAYQQDRFAPMQQASHVDA